MRFSIAVAGLLCGLHAAALDAPRSIAKRALSKRADDDVHVKLLYPERNLSVPIDFFPQESRYEPHSNGTFNLRYFFDDTYYKPGGPVFVLLGGETDVEDRLPYLQKGIVHQVIEATHGLGIILEHRYYGKSFPVPDLTTQNMRFLTTEQALAEVDYFAKNVKFEGIDADLTAPNTPWIVYGGSYAGAQAAFLRVVYPDTFWGTVSSSGVTTAIYDYWEYFEPIRQYGPPDCIKATQFLIDMVDGIMLRQNDTSKIQTLKSAFGLGNITDNRDFANQLTGVYGWQSTSWDPAVNSASFFNYCANITASQTTAENLRPTVADLAVAAGFSKNDMYVQDVALNAIAWVNGTVLPGWRQSGESQDSYFTTVNASAYQGLTSLADYGSVSWNWQVCTEWGYIQTGNTPSHIKPLISRSLDLEYLTFSCRAQFNITSPPETDRVNKYGNYSIEYERLAIFGGNADPWRPATPLWYPDTRNTSVDRPWHLISHGVHHWEENGIFPNETTPTLPPYQIVYAQQYLKNFVVDWLQEFKDKKSSHYEL